MVTKLSPEQESMIPRYVEKYTDLAFSTEKLPEDKTELNALLNEVYKVANYESPQLIIYFRSPIEALRGFKLFKICETLNIPVLDNYVRGNVLKDGWLDDLKTLEKQLDPKQLDEIKEAVAGESNSFSYGCSDIGWIAFYEFWRKEVGIEGLDAIVPLEKLVGKVGWFIAHSNICFVSQNPTFWAREGNVASSKTGPALEFEDGEVIYAVNGQHVPSLLSATLSDVKEV